MVKFKGCEKALAAFLLCVATAMVAPAQTYKTLASFTGTNGTGPAYEALVQGVDGNFYGTTEFGGANGGGTVFKVTPAGIITTLYSFCSLASCADGKEPFVGLAQGTDGNFYGTTFYGGANINGTAFKITPAGVLTTIYSFCTILNGGQCADGQHPWGTLVQGTDGNFYGTTYQGGTGTGSSGTVFKITPAGILTTLYNFCSQNNCTDGSVVKAGLVQATNGLFYGTTVSGGANGSGTVFSITSGGTLTTYSFNNTDGFLSQGAMVQGSNGNLYGTTALGGTGCAGNGCGTVFEMTPAGVLTTLHLFNGTDGQSPDAALVQATDGNFYGTTQQGGANGFGTVFKLSTGGTLTTLYNFCPTGLPCTSGGGPLGGLVQATNGTFYGTAGYGASQDGTVFSLATGLGPFVKTLPTSGKVGAKVIILGNNLTGTTAVTFNGAAATFTVISSTEIKTTVPTGATTGKVTVTTPRRVLKSNVAFRVR